MTNVVSLSSLVVEIRTFMQTEGQTDKQTDRE